MEMKFAYLEMLKGKKVKRPCFKGYWFIDGVTGDLKIHLANGEEITDGKLGLTVQNTLAEDWQVTEATDETTKVGMPNELLVGMPNELLVGMSNDSHSINSKIKK